MEKLNNYNSNIINRTLLSLFIIFSGFYIQAQSISINDYNQATGTTLLVSLQMDNLNNIGALTLFIEYDTLVLEYDTVLNTNAQFPGLMSNDMQGQQQVGIVWSAEIAGFSVVSEELCQIRFNYIDSSSVLSFGTQCEVADFNADIMAVTYNNGSISESFIVEILGLDLSYCTNDPTVVLSGSPVGGIFEVNSVIANSFNPGTLGSGTHTVSYAYVNNYGFGDTVSVNVVVSDNPVVNVANTGSICFGQAFGEATVNIVSGQSPYIFEWSNGQSTQTATSLVSGIYQVTLTDNTGCTTTGNTEIFTSDEIIYDMNVSHLSALAANDGAIDLTISSGNSPFQVLWSNDSTIEDISSLQHGVYSLTITDNGGCTQEDSAEVKINSTQNIIIPQQWTLISFNIDLYEPLFDSVVSQLSTNLILAKDENGNVYWTFFQLNDIGSVIIGEGYQMKLAVQDTLILDGFYIFPENAPINLPAGWSFFGCLNTYSLPVISTFSPFVSEIKLVKDGGGDVYWPFFGVDQIEFLNPGEGYQINMLTQQILVYPPN